MITISNSTNWLAEHANANPDSNAVITPEKIINYKEYYNLSLNIFYNLKTSGIKEEDKIGLLIGHNEYFLFLVNAIWFCEAIPVPLNTKLSKNELKQQIELLGIKYIIYDDKLHNSLTISNQINIPLSELIKERKPDYKNHQTYYFTPSKTALIMFTSGSTNKPKAVIHTFENILESVKALDSFIRLSKNDIWLASLPFYHIGGFMIICRALISGSAVAIPDSLKPESIKFSILSNKPTHVSFVSTMLYRLLEDKFYPPENLKYVFLGGGPIETVLCKKAIDNGWNIVKVYGSTETCSMISALDKNEFNQKPNSVGKPLKNVQIKIIGPNENELTEFEKGEIAIRCKSLFKNYIGTNELRKTRDDFFLTGDIGWVDKNGYLFIESRKDDIIITGGENVSASEVENAIKKLSFIKDVYVFPEKDDIWGQSISAAIVLSEQKELNEIKKSLTKLLPSFKIPKNFYILSIIPRTETGKINRSELLSSIKKVY